MTAAPAVGAGVGLRPRLRAGAVAVIAADGRVERDLTLDAEGRLAEAQPGLHAEVSTPSLTSLPAAEPATGEHLGEEVLHVREDVARALESAATLEASVAELVVDLALLVVGEDLVGLVAGTELGIGRRVARVSIRVVLQGLALVRLAHLVGARGAFDAQDLVVIALFGHPALIKIPRGGGGLPAEGKTWRLPVNTRTEEFALSRPGG